MLNWYVGWGIPYKYVGATLAVARFNKGYVKRMFTGGRPARNERAKSSPCRVFLVHNNNSHHDAVTKADTGAAMSKALG